MTPWLRPRLTFFGRSWSTFQVCGVTGLAVGWGLAMLLGARAGLSPLVTGGLLVVGALTFLALAMGTKIATGREALIYYHHEVAILAACAGLLWALGAPVLPYLDLTTVGLGTFLGFGRVGCLMVGCCHGRPHRWGVRYGEVHAVEGFPDCYVGARLLPVQAMEATFVLAMVAASALVLLQGHPPGTVLSWYVVAYAAVRFWIERLRGDAVRPYWLGFSEAQWTSLVLASGMVLAEWRGRVPLSWWHVALAGVIALGMVALSLRKAPTADLLHARHVSEIASIVRGGPASNGAIEVRRTSLAVGLSIERLPRHRGAAVLFALSRAGRPLTEGEAGALAGVIVNLAPRACDRHRLLRGRHDVFHFVTWGAPTPHPMRASTVARGSAAS